MERALERMEMLNAHSVRMVSQLRSGVSLPHYDGTGSFAAFQESLNDYMSANQMTDGDGCSILPATLSGRAREALRKIPQKKLDDGEFTDVMDELAELCDTEDVRILAQAEFSSIRQGSRSVQVYANLLKDAASRAFPGEEKSTTMRGQCVATARRCTSI